MEKIKKIDPTLLDMCIGILLFGVLCQFTLVWFLKDRFGFSLGLWIGILLAIGSAVHMRWSIDRYLDYSADAAKLATRYNLVRYMVILIVAGAVMITEIAQPLAVFLGIMGLKVAVYIQPFTHKLIRR